MATNIGSGFEQFGISQRTGNYKAPKAKEAPVSKEPVKGFGDIKDTVEISSGGVSAEEGLSDKAKSLLGKLREQYGDYGFAVAGSNSEFTSMRGASDKEYTVIFTADELEKMAEDDDYAAEQMKQVESLIDMAGKLEEDDEFQTKLDELAKKGYILQNLSISMNSEGGVDVFAELEKVSEKQAERIEEKRAQAKEEAKAESKDAEKEAIAKKFEAPKKAFIKASSVDELISTIKGLDDAGIEALMSKPGARLDFTV